VGLFILLRLSASGSSTKAKSMANLVSTCHDANFFPALLVCIKSEETRFLTDNLIDFLGDQHLGVLGIATFVLIRVGVNEISEFDASWSLQTFASVSNRDNRKEGSGEQKRFSTVVRLTVQLPQSTSTHQPNLPLSTENIIFGWNDHGDVRVVR